MPAQVVAAFCRDPDRDLPQGGGYLWDLLEGEELLVTRRDIKGRKRMEQTTKKLWF